MILRVLGVFSGLVAAMALVVLVLLAAIYLPGLHRGPATSSPVAQDFSRTDFITIILTALGVMLAALGLVLALAGAVGYVTVRAAAERAAEDAAKAAADKAAREVAERVAEKEAGLRAEAVATRLVRGLVPQLLSGREQPGADEGDAFARAEGEK